MSVSSSTGIVSGLDTATIISGLMAIESASVTRLETKQSTIESQISALGQVKSAIASLEEAAAAISSADDLYSYTGTFADTSVGTTTVTSDAVAGSYTITVDQLATANKLRSDSTVDTSAGGTLTIELGSTSTGSFVSTSSVDITVDADASLSDIASSINSSDAGVTATVINGSDGEHLVLTSNSTGEANQIKVSSSAITGLNYDPDDTDNSDLTLATEAKDASITVDGVTITSSSNTISDAITGVTLNLTAETDSETTLTVSNDTSNLEDLLQTFVDAYNSARSTMKTLTAYDSSGDDTGILNGDNTVTSALNQLRSLLSTVPSGASSSYQYLSSLGVVTSSDGTLSLDTDTLESAMSSDFAAVAQTVAAYGDAFDTLTTSMNDTDGSITSHIDSLQTQSDDLTDRIDTMTRMLEITQARYEAQFAALETLLSTLQNSESYITALTSSSSSS